MPLTAREVGVQLESDGDVEQSGLGQNLLRRKPLPGASAQFERQEVFCPAQAPLGEGGRAKRVREGGGRLNDEACI